LYDFDLDVLTRLTNGNTTPAHDFFKDCVSLSHDGQWIAFHGAPDEADYGNYEIYKIRADGTGLAALTSTPGDLSAHPGWSPDGTEIVHVKLTGGIADIYVIDSVTGAVKRRLTDTAFEDNDPDWSPDGTKIIFKSKRWSGKEQLAVMDADGDASVWPDGKNVMPLTANLDSDHDGVFSPDGQWVYFERYVGPGLWTDSIQFLWPPKDPLWAQANWEIRKVRADGLEETLLKPPYPGIGSEWLPLSERSAEGGTVFLRSWGLEYSVVHRVPPAGGPAVPLVPELTFVTFMDWK
jgi:Tol biopolymer transport system component